MNSGTQHVALLFAMSVILPMDGVSAQQPAEPRFSASTTAVVVDVVVRDKQDRPVAGLKADDFTVFEDGKRQEVTSFVAVGASSESPISSASGETRPAALRPDDPPTIVALVFEQLGPTGRDLSVKAAERLIKTTVGSSGFAGIFGADPVHTIVPLCNDMAALKDGLKTAATSAGLPIAHDSTDGAAYQRMHATLDSLGMIIGTLEHFPGRKTVILFSEGLATSEWVNDNRRDHFDRLMAQANRAHVAFYTFDAAGLRTKSLLDQRDGAPYVGLQMMADETGGAYVDSTNDLTTGIERITADLRQYYLLGYVASKPPDDKYRAIEVKVKGKNLTVLARKGYRASKGPDLAVVTAPEVAPLLLLERSAEANGVSMRVGTLRVTTTDSQNRAVLLARVPLSALTFVVAPDGTKPTARLTIVARVKNGKSEVVQYAARTYDLTGQAGLTTAGTGDLLFYREVTLPPGRLNLEFVAFDARNEHGSIRRMVLDATPAEPTGLRAGDLIVAHGLQRLSGSRTAAASAMPALQFGDLVVLPNLGEPVSPASDLVFAFEAFAEPGAGETEGSVAVMQEARPASAPVTLKLFPSKESGRIGYVGHIPIGMLAPGTYDLVLTLRQATRMLTRTTTFTVQGAAGQ